MLDTNFPAWAWPTTEAKRAHYFPAAGEPSACRRYFAGLPAAMAATPPVMVSEVACATCRKRAPLNLMIPATADG